MNTPTEAQHGRTSISFVLPTGNPNHVLCTGYVPTVAIVIARHRSGGLELAVCHLNASVGPKLSTEQLALALRTGSAFHEDFQPVASALILSMFNELTPRLILRCAAEVGADVRQADQLYREALSDFFAPSSEWESAVKHFL